VQFRIEDLHRGVALDVLGADDALAGNVDAQRGIFIGEQLDAQALQVEDDFGDDFLHAFQRGELVARTLEAGGHHGRALQT
jgi:hypothetical protein